jgi:putative transposase
MPNYRRAREATTYFFTVVTENRAKILLEPHARNALRNAMLECQNSYPFTTEAIALLPDHIHTIWTLPDTDTDYSRRWSFIKRRFTQMYLETGGLEQDIRKSKQKRRERGIWQRRFWEHEIKNDLEFERYTDYIHFNPVKHGLARCSSEYPHTTFHQFVGRGIYPNNWGCLEHPPTLPETLETGE